MEQKLFLICFDWFESHSFIIDFDETTLFGQLRASLRPLFKWKNTYLLLPLCSTGK